MPDNKQVEQLERSQRRSQILSLVACAIAAGAVILWFVGSPEVTVSPADPGAPLIWEDQQRWNQDTGERLAMIESGMDVLASRIGAAPAIPSDDVEQRLSQIERSLRRLTSQVGGTTIHSSMQMTSGLDFSKLRRTEDLVRSQSGTLEDLRGRVDQVNDKNTQLARELSHLKRDIAEDIRDVFRKIERYHNIAFTPSRS